MDLNFPELKNGDNQSGGAAGGDFYQMNELLDFENYGMNEKNELSDKNLNDATQAFMEKNLNDATQAFMDAERENCNVDTIIDNSPKFSDPVVSQKITDIYDDDFFRQKPSAATKSNTDESNSGNESPIVSCNPSPIKKVTDILKEQENEKFISSEDLLSDFKDDCQQKKDKIANDNSTKVENVAAKNSPIEKTSPPPSNSSGGDKYDKKDRKYLNSKNPKILSVEAVFYKYGLDAWFKPERLHPKVESLIYWRDVKKSGIVFGAGIITLLAISCFSVISVFAYLSLISLTGTIGFRIYKSVMQAIQKTSDGHPFKEFLELDITLSQDKIQQFVSVSVAHINGFVVELRRLFLVEDLIDSLKFGVILWVMTYIGAWFNGMTLVILAFVSLFTLPKVYENNKQSIDTYLDLVRSKLTEITDKVKVAIPIGNKKPIAVESDKDK